jgi:hypothetical protein
MGVICLPYGFCMVFLRPDASLLFVESPSERLGSLKRCVLFVHYQSVTLSTKNKCRFPREKDFITSVPDNDARKMLFQSMYLRLRSTVSRHLKVCKGWRREKRQPSTKETKEDFCVGVV